MTYLKKKPNKFIKTQLTNHNVDFEQGWLLAFSTENNLLGQRLKDTKLPTFDVDG